MKKIFFSLLLLMTSFSAFSQETDFEKKYNALMNYLEKEDWVNAEKSSFELKESIEPLDSFATEKMVLRYIYIYSVSGLMSDRKLTKEEALNKIVHLKGKEMIMPAHPFNPNCYVNCTQFMKEEKSTFFTGVNNANGTQIFSFEYVKIKNGIKESESELLGKYITLKGKLNKIAVNGNMFPRFTLNFIKGEYQVTE